MTLLLPDGVQLLVAPNPGPMTLEGTCTWRIDGAEPVVVDPGPLHEGHLRAVADLGPVSCIVLTHAHADHVDGAARLHELTGAPVAAYAPELCVGRSPLRDGDRVGRLQVVHTPGHTADSICLLMDGALVTGDTLLGRGSTVVMHPDGSTTDYLASLGRLRDVARDRPDLRVLPGHGPALASLAEVVEGQLAHREQRVREVEAAVRAGAKSAQAVVASVYGQLDPVLHRAALLTVRATLAHLGVTLASNEEVSGPGG